MYRVRRPRELRLVSRHRDGPVMGPEPSAQWPAKSDARLLLFILIVRAVPYKCSRKMYAIEEKSPHVPNVCEGRDHEG